MKELTITKKYLVFSNTDFIEAQKYLDEEEAYFGDTEEEIKRQIDDNETSEFTSILTTKSYGSQFVNDYDSHYYFVAVAKPEEKVPLKKGK